MNEVLLREFEGRRKHAWEKLHWSIPSEHRRGRFLDIGCGCGSGLVAALQHGFDSAVGLDRSFCEFSWFEVQDFDPLCTHYGVNPAGATLIQADLFGMSLQPQAFNCVFMLDSIEHVPDPRQFINAAARFVAPGGYLFIDTAPLYYSKVGHHLWAECPPDVYPWAHLRKDWSKLQRSRGITDWSMERFRELNKVTHAEITQFVRDTGLEIVDEHRDQPGPDDLLLLEQHRPGLDLAGIDEQLLFETWILLLARRPEGRHARATDH